MYNSPLLPHGIRGMDKSGTSHIARALRGEGSSGKPSLARGFRLGKWQVRPDLCTLQEDGQSTQLEPKTMGVLLCLAEHAPQVVTREQFIEEVWNGRVVSDEVLSRAISLLRSQLEDDAQNPRFVRTIPRVGYSLIAPVEVPAPAKQAATQVPRSRLLAWTTALAGLAIIAVLGVWWLTRGTDAPTDGQVRLAVLPLAGQGSKGGESDLADGLTDELTISLARVNGIRVVARNSALRFRSGDADLTEAAQALGATHLLTGSVRASNDRLRITVHLADSATGTEIWSDSYDRGFGELFSVQAEIAASVAQALRRSQPEAAAGIAQVSIVEAAPANPEAYRLYLQGRQQLARRGEEGLRAAIGLLEKSIAADPGFVRAQFAVAWACTLLANAAPSESAAAIACADRALVTVARETGMSPEGHAVQAWLGLERNRWIDAEAAFREALAATPDDTEVRLLHSQMLGALGNSAAAKREAEQALANDPLSPAVFLRQAVLALWADDDREAASLLAKARELDLAPSASPEVPMLLYVRMRQFDALEKALRDVQSRRGQADDWVRPTVAAVRDSAQGAAAEAAMERAATAGQVEGLMHFGALVLAQRNERALRWLLERPQLRTRELEFTLSASEAAGLRSLPDFQQVVTRFGLDSYWDRYGWPAQCGRSAGVIACH